MGNVSVPAALPTATRATTRTRAGQRIARKLLDWAAVSDATIRELAEFIAIESVSPDPARFDEVLRAADWVVERIERAGGQAERVDWHGQPLVVGEVRASQNAESAPTVLCCGHFDVQPAEPLELWTSDPFVLTEDGEWLVARGVADDK